MRNIFAYIQISVFFIALLGMAALTFMIPHEEVSLLEKRKLTSMPIFNENSIISGKYTDSLSKYFADHFAFRENLMDISFALKEMKGLRGEDEVKIYHTEVKESQNTTATIQTDLMTPDTSKNSKQVINWKTAGWDEIFGEDSSKSASNGNVYSPELDSAAEKGLGRTIDNVFICNGMAFQFFGGTNYMARSFARVVNRYANELTDVKVYCAIAPSSAEYYLPKKYQKMKRSETQNIAETLKHLDKAIGVDVCAELAKHTDEYLFFNTDHHWTGLGAYYAYKAWCDVSGTEAITLEKMKRKVIKNYYGSLYAITRAPDLARNKDSVEYWKSNVKTSTVYFLEENMSKSLPGTYLVEYANAMNGYGVFLGADYPLMEISTNIETDKRVLIIKNSYGNPFATYFVNHFEKVFVVDYRYYHQDLRKLIEKKKITDIVFLMGSFSTNTTWHIQKTNIILSKPIPKSEKKVMEKKEKTVPEKKENEK